MTVAEAMARSAIVLAPRWGPLSGVRRGRRDGLPLRARLGRRRGTPPRDRPGRRRTQGEDRSGRRTPFWRGSLPGRPRLPGRGSAEGAVSPVPDVVPPPVSTEAAPPRGEVGDEFASAIRKYFGSEYLAHEPGRAEVRDEWIRYALSTNDRGEALLARSPRSSASSRGAGAASWTSDAATGVSSGRRSVPVPLRLA